MPIIKVVTHTGGLVPATSPSNYSPEEFTRRDWSQGLVPSSVYTQGPIAQERQKLGANGVILSLYSFLKKPKFLK